MDREERKLRFLEGLGYVAAFMIGLGGLTDVQVLKYFNILGLVFAIIAAIKANNGEAYRYPWSLTLVK